MSSRHRDCKHQRHEKRQILAETLTLEAFTPSNNSTQKVVGMELSGQLKRQQNAVLQPQAVDCSDGCADVRTETTA